MSRSGIVNVRMVITEEKILSNIEKVQKLINPNSKKQIVQLEEDTYFKDLIESVKTYLIEYPKKKNFPASVYKAAYGLVEYATNQFEENTKKIEELIRQREQNIALAGELKELLEKVDLDKLSKEIRKELESFSPKLLTKEEIIIDNKLDVYKAKENLEEFKKKIKNKNIFEVTALINEGLDEVINKLSELTKSIEDTNLYDDEVVESHVLYKFKKEKPFTIVKDKDVYVIKGDAVEKLFRMTNFNTEEAYERFSNKLRRMGIDEELEKMGIQDGDTVRIFDFEFEWTR